MARRRQFSFNNTQAALQSSFAQQDAMKLALFRELLNRQSAEQDDARAAAAAALAARLNRENIWSQNPTAAMAAHRGGIQEAAPFIQTSGQQLAPLFKGIGDAKSVPDVPSDESLIGQTGGMFNPDRAGIDQLLAAAKARREQLAPFGARTSVEETNPDGSQTTRFIPNDQLGGQTFNTGLSAQQLGANKATELLTGELSPGVSAANARKAGAQAGATAAASTQATISTKDKNLDALGRIARAEQPPLQTPPGGTEGERRAGTLFAPMAMAHQKAIELEDKGAMMPPGGIMVSNSPAAQRALGRFYNPTNLQYVQAAKEFGNIYTLVVSGAQTREEELPRYLSTLFTHSDDPAEKSSKRQARQNFLDAMSIAVGRSDDEVGAILGAAIQEGRLSPEFMKTLKNITPGMAAGFAKHGIEVR